MFLCSWARAENNTNQSQQARHDDKQTLKDPSSNEIAEFESRSGLLRGARCDNHILEPVCWSIKRRAWLHWVRWCLLLVPFWFFHVRPWAPSHEDTVVLPDPIKPLHHKQKPVYAMSNYPVSALHAHSAFAVSNVHGLNVHVNAVASNLTCT